MQKTQVDESEALRDFKIRSGLKPSVFQGYYGLIKRSELPAWFETLKS